MSRSAAPPTSRLRARAGRLFVHRRASGTARTSTPKKASQLPRRARWRGRREPAWQPWIATAERTSARRRTRCSGYRERFVGRGRGRPGPTTPTSCSRRAGAGGGRRRRHRRRAAGAARCPRPRTSASRSKRSPPSGGTTPRTCGSARARRDDRPDGARGATHRVGRRRDRLRALPEALLLDRGAPAAALQRARPRASAPRSTGGSSGARAARRRCSRSTTRPTSPTRSSPASPARSNGSARRSWRAGSPDVPRSTRSGAFLLRLERLHGQRADRRDLRRARRPVGGRGLEDGRRAADDDPLPRCSSTSTGSPASRSGASGPRTSRSPTCYLASGDEVSHPMERSRRGAALASTEALAVDRRGRVRRRRPGPQCTYCDFRAFCEAGKAWLGGTARPGNASADAATLVQPLDLRPRTSGSPPRDRSRPRSRRARTGRPGRPRRGRAPAPRPGTIRGRPAGSGPRRASPGAGRTRRRPRPASGGRPSGASRGRMSSCVSMTGRRRRSHATVATTASGSSRAVELDLHVRQATRRASDPSRGRFEPCPRAGRR